MVRASSTGLAPSFMMGLTEKRRFFRDACIRLDWFVCYCSKLSNSFMLEMIDAFVRNQDLILGSRSFLYEEVWIIHPYSIVKKIFTGIFQDFHEY